MTDSTFWWILTGVAVAVELATGTFYLLMFAVGLAAGALAAYAGWGLAQQIVIAAVVGGGAVVALRALRGRAAPPEHASANRDVNLDIGEQVHVNVWNTDGTANVKYRGANWTVGLADGAAARPGQFKVRRVVGNRLIVENVEEN